jgi:hypothetical protein
MRKPENFHKIDNADLIIGSVNCRIDVSKEGFFVFGEGVGWNNVVLFEMNWDKDQYNVKICVLGEGNDGWYLHENLPIPKSLMKTLSSFKEFVKSNILDVASKVDLMNIKPNMMGITELDAVEIKHTVASSSGPNVSYIVTENTGGVRDVWACTCPAFMYSKATPQTCKHIIQIK